MWTPKLEPTSIFFGGENSLILNHHHDPTRRRFGLNQQLYQWLSTLRILKDSPWMEGRKNLYYAKVFFGGILKMFRHVWGGKIGFCRENHFGWRHVWRGKIGFCREKPLESWDQPLDLCPALGSPHSTAQSGQIAGASHTTWRKRARWLCSAELGEGLVQRKR